MSSSTGAGGDPQQSWARQHLPALIIGLILAIVAGIFGLYQGKFAGTQSASSAPTTKPATSAPSPEPTATAQSACPPPEEDTPSRLGLGERLDRGQSLRSPSGRYALIMRGDGVLLLCDTRTGESRWHAGTGEHPGSYATLGLDGNFGLYAPYNGTDAIWATNTDQTDAIAVVVEDAYSGRAVLEARGGARHWWISNGAAPVVEGSDPQVANELRQGEVLKPGEFLRKGTHTLTMEKDGSLVLRSGDKELWRPPDRNTTGYHNSALAMQFDNNLVMYYKPYSPYPEAIWASGTDERGTEVLRLAADGRLALYGPNVERVLFTP